MARIGAPAGSASAATPRLGQEMPGAPNPSTPDETPAREWTRGAADLIVPRENPGGVVYGVIVIGALLAAESDRHETYAAALGSAVIAAALYWLAHSYAKVIGHRLSEGKRLTARTLSRALAHDWAIVRGAAIPILALLVCWAAGVAQQTGVTVSLWSAAVSLVALELAAGVRSRATARELTLEAGVGILMGLAILALKVVLH